MQVKLDMLTTFTTILSFTLSFVVGGMLIFRLLVLARKKRMFDECGGRHAHSGYVPRIAGIAFFPAIFFTVIAIVLLCSYLPMVQMDEFTSYFWSRLLSFLLGFGLLYVVGVHDDLFGVGYKSKFIGQFLVSFIVVGSGLYMNSLCGILGIYEIPAWLGMLITSVLIVATINAFNLFDGIDGLCAGLSLGICTMILIWLTYKQANLFAIITAAVMGTIVAYLFFNLSTGKSKVFMGDTGSMSLGYIVIFMLLVICTHNRMYYVSTGETELTALGFVFFPLFDMTRVFTVRILHGKSPFLPDKNHLHHKVLKVTGSHIKTSAIILTAASGLAIMNFLLRSYNIHLVIFLDFAYAMALNILFNKLSSRS